MANYKLTNDYWETSGIYDIGQGKTQREINKGIAGAIGSKEPTTVSGDIVSFEDGVEGVPFKNLTVKIEPVQSGSGDPSPENVRPITGWTGANVYRTGFNQWDEEWEVGAFSSSNGLPVVVSDRIRSKNYIPCLPETYYYCGKEGYQVYYYDSNFVFLGWNTFASAIGNRIKTPSGTRYMMFNASANSGATYNHDVCINISDPAKDGTYEPYQGETYEIEFPSEAGTVYGGTLDVTNGVLTVDRKMIDLSSIAWARSTQNTNVVYYASFTDGKTTDDFSLVCSQYPNINDALYQQDNIIRGYGSVTYGFSRCAIRDDSKNDLTGEQFRTAMSGVQCVYPLDTPITYTLTPTEVKALLGQNNVWADCGDVDVEYGAYLTVVENQLGEKIPKVAIAPIEKTTTASKAYSVNELFFMGDKLYIATASIASGATFTVGTNCDETTLGEQITALLNA